MDIIPMTPTPEVSVPTELLNTDYIFVLNWNRRTQSWYIDITENGVLKSEGDRLSPGINLAAKWNLNIKNMYAINLTDPTQEFTFYGLGSTCVVAILTDEEAATLESQQ